MKYLINLTFTIPLYFIFTQYSCNGFFYKKKIIIYIIKYARPKTNTSKLMSCLI